MTADTDLTARARAVPCTCSRGGNSSTCECRESLTEEQLLTARAQAVLTEMPTHRLAALGECAHGMWGMRRDLPPLLWRYRCNCGGLCDSGMPCPMGGDSYELTDIGHECARLAHLLPTAVDFHGHLDACEQCREHPFALCSVGARLLSEGTVA